MTIIRQGEAKKVKVKLAEKEVMPLDDNNPWGIPPGPWKNPAGAEVMNFMPNVKIQIPAGGSNFSGTIHRNGQGVNEEMRWNDDDGQLVITNGKDGRRLVATDKSGATIFSGPIDTAEQLQQ